MTAEVNRVRIGELAAATGTTARALRHYERAGLIRSTRESNGYRDFGPSSVIRVRNIRVLLAAGLTLDDIDVFRDCLDGDVETAPPSPRGRTVVQERLQVLDARIAAHTERRNQLAVTLARTTGSVRS